MYTSLASPRPGFTQGELCLVMTTVHDPSPSLPVPLWPRLMSVGFPSVLGHVPQAGGGPTRPHGSAGLYLGWSKNRKVYETSAYYLHTDQVSVVLTLEDFLNVVLKTFQNPTLFTQSTF